VSVAPGEMGEMGATRDANCWPPSATAPSSTTSLWWPAACGAAWGGVWGVSRGLVGAGMTR
jgi:hypothetical protein